MRDFKFRMCFPSVYLGHFYCVSPLPLLGPLYSSSLLFRSTEISEWKCRWEVTFLLFYFSIAGLVIIGIYIAAISYYARWRKLRSAPGLVNIVDEAIGRLPYDYKNELSNRRYAVAQTGRQKWRPYADSACCRDGILAVRKPQSRSTA